MSHRRARPTLRVISEDLTNGWESPLPVRLVAERKYHDLHPVSELKHPLIVKALESFNGRPGEENYVGPIRCSGDMRLLEIKTGQWRGGVWVDPESGVHWLCVAGLAKGDHRDNDDFYEALERDFANGSQDRFLPTDGDRRLLKIETFSRTLTEWDLRIQELALSALSAVASGGSKRFRISHPTKEQRRFATITLSITRVVDPDYQADECTLEVDVEPAYRGTNLAWQMTTRLLIAVCPPEQDWDRTGDLFSNILEPGGWRQRTETLKECVKRNEVIPSVPGIVSHYCHRDHLAGSTIEGTAVRALCGVFLVPTQDHESLPVCPECETKFAALPV